jgi:NADP-dependent 3-hydroxy acid dehydrogenase YdfG
MVEEFGGAVTRALTGQVVVVTGASSGIGRSLAIALAGQGAGVVLAARRESELGRVAHQIRDSDGASRVWVCPTDLSRESDIERLRGFVNDHASRLDVLIHCGGAYKRTVISHATAADFDELYQANVRGPFLLSKLSLPLLRASKGQIVFVNSSAGVSARSAAGQFAGTQHALRAVADAFRDEVNADGIRVLTLHLGRTATPRIERIYEAEGKSYQPEVLMQPEDVATVVVAALALPRTAEVTEIHMRPLAKSY